MSRKLELELIKLLPDNGTREAAIMDLKRKWEREDEAAKRSDILACILSTMAIIITLSSMFWILS